MIDPRFDVLPYCVRERIVDSIELQEDSGEECKARILGGYPHLSDERQVALRMDKVTREELLGFAEQELVSLERQVDAMRAFAQGLRGV